MLRVTATRLWPGGVTEKLAVLAALEKSTGNQGVSLRPTGGGLRKFGGLKNVDGVESLRTRASPFRVGARSLDTAYTPGALHCLAASLHPWLDAGSLQESKSRMRSVTLITFSRSQHRASI